MGQRLSWSQRRRAFRQWRALGRSTRAGIVRAAQAGRDHPDDEEWDIAERMADAALVGWRWTAPVLAALAVASLAAGFAIRVWWLEAVAALAALMAFLRWQRRVAAEAVRRARGGRRPPDRRR